MAAVLALAFPAALSNDPPSGIVDEVAGRSVTRDPSGANQTKPRSKKTGEATAPVMAEAGADLNVARAVRSGAWSAPTTWNLNRPPAAGEAVEVATGTLLKLNVQTPLLAGVTVHPGATLEFDPGVTAVLNTSRNVVARGVVRMKPAAAVVHRIAFSAFNEDSFVGGGLDPVASDVGLWVSGDGKLDVAGATKVSWSRLAGAASAGATTVTLEGDPVGWRIGDHISIAPTESPKAGAASATGFEDRAITGISGRTLTLDKALQRAHPDVPNPGSQGGSWRAEVMNLSRNVQITGENSLNRAHVFVRSTVPQNIRNAEIRFMGPRKDTNGNGRTERILGRYPLHFHMMSRVVTHDLGDGTRPPVRQEKPQPLPNSNGTIVDGVVVRDGGSHAFVAHESDGVSFKNVVGYNIIETPFWWDDLQKNPATKNKSNGFLIPASRTNRTTVESSIMARVVRKEADGKIVEIVDGEAGAAPRVAGYTLGTGDGNEIKHSIAVGVDGQFSSGFDWPGGSGSVWGFSTGNIAHNNLTDGIYAWQNNLDDQQVSNFVGYHNGGLGVLHGAYRNQWFYKNLSLVGNGKAALGVRAVSSTPRLNDAFGVNFDRENEFRDSILDGRGISNSLIWFGDQKQSAELPTWFTNLRLVAPAAGRPKVLVDSPGSTDDATLANFSYCSLAPGEVYFGSRAPAGSKLRVYNSGSDQYQLTQSAAAGPESGYATRTTGPADSFTPRNAGDAAVGANGPWPLPAPTQQS